MRFYKFLFAFCVSWFVFLCLLHYFSLRPPWLDEKFVLDSIENLSFRAIFGPLRHSQVFPRLYLILIKFLSERFSYNVLSLRFLPLLSMLFAFFIWAKVYKSAFSSRWEYLLALFSFSSSYHLSYYAAELKQYSMDVLVVGIFCLYIIYQRRYIEEKPTILFGIVTFLLPLALLFSYISFFLFWIVLYNFLFIARKDSRVSAATGGALPISGSPRRA